MWLDFLLSLGFFFQKPPELPSHQHDAVEKISMPTIYLGGDIMLSRSVGAMPKNTEQSILRTPTIRSMTRRKIRLFFSIWNHRLQRMTAIRTSELSSLRRIREM